MPFSAANLRPKNSPHISASKIWPLPKLTVNPVTQSPVESRITPPAPIAPLEFFRDPSNGFLSRIPDEKKKKKLKKREKRNREKREKKVKKSEGENCDLGEDIHREEEVWVFKA